MATREIWDALHARANRISLLHALFISSFALTMIGGALGNRDNTRYFIPMYIVIPLGAALLTQTGPRLLRILMVTAILMTAGNFWWAGNARALRPYARQSYEKLRTGLPALGISGGFADYWIAYWITAVSNEKILLAPLGDNDS